jgi:pyruvate/2-oxoglutarate/acetoin dehydrogenase E1 component
MNTKESFRTREVGGSLSYFSEIQQAMTYLGQQPDTIFLGQSIAYPGNAMYKTLSGVPMDKRVELPVVEDCQLGMSLGLSLTGKVVISIYPRFDFLLLATNQLVNHLDKLEEFTHSEYNAKVIIRVGIGSTSPMYPGVQHCGDYTDAFRAILNMPVLKLDNAYQVMPVYTSAYSLKRSCLIVEEMNLY